MSRQRNRKQTDKQTIKPVETAAAAAPAGQADEDQGDMSPAATDLIQQGALSTTADSMPMVEVAVRVPISMSPPRGYVCNRMDAHLTREQSLAAWCLRDALNRLGARMKNGRYVQTTADAVRWMLEATVAELLADLQEAANSTVQAKLSPSSQSFNLPELGASWTDGQQPPPLKE